MIRDPHQEKPNENRQDHYVQPDELRIGLYVHLDLGWMDHPFTFGNFKIKDEEQILKIRALNLKKIRYDPLRSDAMPDFPRTIQQDWATTTPLPLPVNPPNLLHRSNRLKQLNENILASQRAFANHTNVVREALQTLQDQPEHSKGIAENLVKDMVDSVITESDVVLHAISDSNSDQVKFVHSLNVTVLALMLAKSLDMQEKEAADLGVAAMFHDIGKAENPQNKLVVDLHCEAGARIALSSGLSERISKIILQHHEYMDGSGFPMHLREGKIDPLARVLSLVNHYDNLCNPSNPAEAMTPYEALSKMYVNQSQKFDSSMLRLFVRLLGVYPPGSIVQLSNDVYGIVLAVNPNKPLLPLVMLYVPEVARETPVVVDLGEEKDLKIKKCIRPTALPGEVFHYLRPSKRVSYYFLKKEDNPSTQSDEEGLFLEKRTQQDLAAPVTLRRA